ncbi:XRE family transcriptional regulator [Actinocorallia sp. A-T 12471]|uniref:XRE family transcriptional regulator n=1 Tax=Actinocorallia sp. A-T 12471 TaxID=3089813 RepID=UPI0029CDECC1|nr:XRE family transcriptional regulator [Actinocorallia sp. A-T 12471]MDX6742895.1 XRE family transcriptional regulator [Actinocorallia sp. A-T 12471]
MAEPPRKEADRARWIRAQGLARGLSIAQIAAEIAEQCGPLFSTSRIKSHRLAGGVALSDVVAQMRALYELDGKPPPKIGETLLSAYESGYKRPGPEYLHYICLVYRVEPGDLGYPGPCVCGRTHDQRPGAAQAAAVRDDAETLIGSVIDRAWMARRQFGQGPPGIEGPGSMDLGEEDVVLRRTLLQLLAGAGVALDGQFLGAVDQLRRKMDDTLVNATVSPTMLDQWEETILGYGQSYQSTPSLRMLCDVLLDFSEVRRLCDQRQPIELQERLCRIAAQLSGISGLIMINLGDHRLARSFFRTARTAADETGDRGLRAWVTVRESLLPLYYGDPREALHLARKAQDLAGRAPNVAAAMAPAVEARALGQLALRGRSDAAPTARRALVRGRAVFDQLSKAQTNDLVFGFTDRQMSFYEGDTYTNLGDHAKGEEVLRNALTLYSPTEIIDRTLVKLDRAHCAIHSGDADAAAVRAKEAILELDPEHRSDILMHRARQLASAAQQQFGDYPLLRELRDTLATVPSVQSPMNPGEQQPPPEQV